MANEFNNNPLKQLLLDKMIDKGYFNAKNIDPSTIQTITDLNESEVLKLLRDFGVGPKLVKKASGGIIDVAPNDRFTDRVTRTMDPVRLAEGGDPKFKSGVASSEAVLQNLPEAVNVQAKGQTRPTTVRALISEEPQSAVRRLAGKGNLFEVAQEMPNGKIRKFTVSLPTGVPTYQSGMDPDDFFKQINNYFDEVDFDKDVSIVEGGKTKTVNKAALIKTAFYKDAFGKLERDAIAGVIEGYPRDYFYETKRDLKTNKAKKVLNRGRFTDFLVKNYDFVPKDSQGDYAQALDDLFKKKYPDYVGKFGGIKAGTKSLKMQFAKSIYDQIVKQYGKSSDLAKNYAGKLTDFVKNKNFFTKVDEIGKFLKPATPVASAVAKRATPLGYAMDFPLVLAAGKAAQEMLEPVIEEKVVGPAAEKMVEGEKMLQSMFMPKFKDGGDVQTDTTSMEISDDDLGKIQFLVQQRIKEKGSGPLDSSDTIKLALDLAGSGQFGSSSEDNINRLINGITLMQGSAIENLRKTDMKLEPVEMKEVIGSFLRKFGVL